MHTRTKTLLGTLLFLCGAFAALGWSWFGPEPRVSVERRLNEIVVLPWLDVLDPNKAFEHPDQRSRPRDIVSVPIFQEAWRNQVDLLADPAQEVPRLRAKLHAYLDFLETEYADAAEIYETGRHAIMSEGAKARRREVEGELQELGGELIEAFDAVREQAYRDSPVTVRGEDPGVRDHTQFLVFVHAWLEEARAVVDEFVVVPQGRD